MTNGANALKNFPTFSSFNIQNADGKVILRLSTFVPFLLAGVCVAVIITADQLHLRPGFQGHPG